MEVVRDWRVARTDGNQNLITATDVEVNPPDDGLFRPIPPMQNFSPVTDRPIAPVKFLRPRLVRRAIRSPRAAPHELNWVLPWNIHQVAAPRDARTHGPTAGYREALGPACRLVFHESEPWDAAALPTRTGECLDARRARASPPTRGGGHTPCEIPHVSFPPRPRLENRRAASPLRPDRAPDAGMIRARRRVSPVPRSLTPARTVPAIPRTAGTMPPRCWRRPSRHPARRTGRTR